MWWIKVQMEFLERMEESVEPTDLILESILIYLDFILFFLERCLLLVPIMVN